MTYGWWIFAAVVLASAFCFVMAVRGTKAH